MGDAAETIGSSRENQSEVETRNGKFSFHLSTERTRNAIPLSLTEASDPENRRLKGNEATLLIKRREKENGEGKSQRKGNSFCTVAKSKPNVRVYVYVYRIRT